MTTFARKFTLCALFSGLILATALLAGCSENKDSPEDKQQSSTETPKYKIGAVLRLSQGASDGVPAKIGIELAKKRINQSGGINGKELEVIYYDSKDAPTTAVNAVQKLISVDNVQAIVGPMMSGNVLAAASICERSKVVMITPTGTSPRISGAGEYIFRLCSRIDLQARALVDKAIKMSDSSHPKVAIIYSNEPYGKGCKKLFTKYLGQKGIKPKAVESFQRGDKDFQAQLTNIESLNPDILFIPGYLQETAPLVSQARQMGIDALSVGVFGDMAPQYIELAGKAAEGHLIAGEYDIDYSTPKNSEFVSAYQKKMEEDPSLPNNIMFAALAFDSVGVLADAMRHGADTGEAIKNYLNDIRGFNGVTGEFSFNSNGDVEKGDIYLFQVQNGKYEKIN